MSADRRWRHRFQVIAHFRNGALLVCCSHRWLTTAWLCESRRVATNRNRLIWAFENRETPQKGAA